MKVQVDFKVEAKIGERAEVLDFIVSPTETVAAVKERIATAQGVIFPDQNLTFNGEVLADWMRLSDCGVKESASLGFVVKVSEESLVKQLVELLLTCALSFDELGMLYCYKYGESASQALKIVGCDENLEAFLKKQKVFRVENGRVTLLHDGTSLQPQIVRKEADYPSVHGEKDFTAAKMEEEKAMSDAATTIQSARRAEMARRQVNTIREARQAARKGNKFSNNHADKQLLKEVALANRMSKVFQEEALVFRESRKAFQDALDELEAEESRRYEPRLVFRESRKAFQDALEELEMEETLRFAAKEDFKNLVFRETRAAIHLALEEMDSPLQ